MRLRGRERFDRYRAVLAVASAISACLPFAWRRGLFDAARMIPGIPGLAVRYILVRSLAASCGDNVSVHPGVYMYGLENLTLGSNVSVHPMCYIDATGGISIGDDVSIAHGASVLSTTHVYDSLGLPIKDQGTVCLPTAIDRDVWIGAKATLLAGCHVRSGAVVGAGAVVTHDVDERTVVVGIPARVLKKRV